MTIYVTYLQKMIGNNVKQGSWDVTIGHKTFRPYLDIQLKENTISLHWALTNNNTWQETQTNFIGDTASIVTYYEPVGKYNIIQFYKSE